MEFAYEVAEESIAFGYGFWIGVPVLVSAVSDQLVWLGVQPFAVAVDAVEVLIECALTCRSVTEQVLSELYG